MSFGFVLRLAIFLLGVWAAIIAVLSLLGEPFLFFPSDNNTALFPPLYRYETLRLTLISMFAYLSLQIVFAPEKNIQRRKSPQRLCFFSSISVP